VRRQPESLLRPCLRFWRRCRSKTSTQLADRHNQPVSSPGPT
jgi:hypothetical protein